MLIGSGVMFPTSLGIHQDFLAELFVVDGAFQENMFDGLADSVTCSCDANNCSKDADRLLG